MRTIELAKIATAAESLRLRRIARRQVLRVAYGVVAAVFGIAVLSVIHVLIVMALMKAVSPMIAVAIMLGIDVVIAAVFGFLAIQSPADSIEIEAKRVRVQALEELKRSLTVMGMAAEVAGTVFGSSRKSVNTQRSRGMIGNVVSGLAGRLSRR